MTSCTVEVLKQNIKRSEPVVEVRRQNRLKQKIVRHMKNESFVSMFQVRASSVENMIEQGERHFLHQHTRLSLFGTT